MINDLPQRLGAIVRESLPTGEFLDLTLPLLQKPGVDRFWTIQMIHIGRRKDITSLPRQLLSS